MDPYLVQGHTLGLPMRQRPRERQGELLPRNLLFHCRGYQLAKNRNPIPPGTWFARWRVIGEKRQRLSLGVHQIH